MKPWTVRRVDEAGNSRTLAEFPAHFALAAEVFYDSMSRMVREGERMELWSPAGVLVSITSHGITVGA